MTNNITLEEAEHLVAQLPLEGQLKLVGRIGERLSGSILPQMDKKRQHREYTAQVETFLKMRGEKGTGYF